MSRQSLLHLIMAGQDAFGLHAAAVLTCLSTFVCMINGDSKEVGRLVLVRAHALADPHIHALDN
jgi:hypothetical protein